MSKKEANKTRRNIIQNGFVICESGGTEWLWDGEDLYIYMDDNGDWEDWAVGEDGIQETEMWLPDDVGGMTLKNVRFCKNQDCGNPFDESDLEVLEWADREYKILSNR